MKIDQFVIPAPVFTGINYGRNPGFSMERNNVWIPVFTGMTLCR
jgi:hypothetical protein